MFCNKCGLEILGRPVSLSSGIYCKACGTRIRRRINRNKSRSDKRIRIEELRKGIKQDPSNAENYFNLSTLLIGDLPDIRSERSIDYESSAAKESYDLVLKALTLGLSDPVQRGRAYLRLGCLKRFLRTPLGKQYLRSAEKEFRLALSYDTDNVYVLEQLEYIYEILSMDDERGEVLARLEEAATKKSIGLPLKSRKAPLSSSQKGVNFEQKCMQIIQSMGFSTHSTKTVADGGIDIIAVSSQPLTQGKYIVQCKNWSKPVGEPIVRDLYGVVASDNAVKGILISSSGFTASAVNFAKGKRLELIDGDQLDYLSLLANKKD